jgi:hypothetical protein
MTIFIGTGTNTPSTIKQGIQLSNGWYYRWLSFFLLFCVFGVTGIKVTFAESAQSQFWQDSVDRPGGDFRSFDIEPKNREGSFLSAEGECQFSCQNDPHCQTWTYVKPGLQGPNARCWLKNVIPAAVANGCCTSGVLVRGFEPHTDRPGGDYSNFDMQTTDPQACQAACWNDPQCKMWTYVRPYVQGPNARCWLKNTTPAAVTSDCCTSGTGKPPLIH